MNHPSFNVNNNEKFEPVWIAGPEVSEAFSLLEKDSVTILEKINKHCVSMKRSLFKK